MPTPTPFVSPHTNKSTRPPATHTHLEAAALGLLVERVARLLPVLVRLAVGLVQAPHAVPPRAVRRPVVLLLPLRTLGCGWVGVAAGGVSVKMGRTNDRRRGDQRWIHLGSTRCVWNQIPKTPQTPLNQSSHGSLNQASERTDLVVRLPDGDLVRRVLPLRDLHARLRDEALCGGGGCRRCSLVSEGEIEGARPTDRRMD